MNQATNSTPTTPAPTLATPSTSRGAPTPAMPTAPLEMRPVVGNASFSPDQLRQMAKWAVEDGHMTPEQAETALKADGVVAALKEELNPHPIDKAFPPGKFEEFQLPSFTEEDGQYTPELQAFDKAARTWLSEGRFTKEIGKYLGEEIDRIATAHHARSDIEKKEWMRHEEQTLRSLYGRDYDRKLELAERLVNELEAKRPGLKELLKVTGASHSAMIVAQLMEQAQRLYDRQQR